jgi:hypothetical protein
MGGKIVNDAGEEVGPVLLNDEMGTCLRGQNLNDKT